MTSHDVDDVGYNQKGSCLSSWTTGLWIVWREHQQCHISLFIIATAWSILIPWFLWFSESRCSTLRSWLVQPICFSLFVANSMRLCVKIFAWNNIDYSNAGSVVKTVNRISNGPCTINPHENVLRCSALSIRQLGILMSYIQCDIYPTFATKPCKVSYAVQYIINPIAADKTG